MMARYTEATVDAFVRYSKRKDIMAAAEIGQTKYYALIRDKGFMQQVQQRKTGIVAAAVQAMESNLSANVDRLQEVICDPPERAQIIINGLQLFFNVFHSLKTDAEILARLDALEKAAEGRL